MFRLGYHYISLIDQSVLDHVITISTKCITSNKTCHSNTMSVELHIVSHMYALNRQLCRKLISSCWAGIDTCPTLSQAVSTVESKRDPLHRSKSKTVTWHRGPLCRHVLWLVYFPTSDIVMSYLHHVITISTKCITSNKRCHSNTMSVELHIVSHMYALKRQLCRKLISSCWAGIDTCPTLSQAVSTVESKRDPLHRSKSKTVTWHRGPLCRHVITNHLHIYMCWCQPMSTNERKWPHIVNHRFSSWYSHRYGLDDSEDNFDQKQFTECHHTYLVS